MPDKAKTPPQDSRPQDPGLRRPPRAGGPRREEIITRRSEKKQSRLKKALPYLIPAAATGGGIALATSLTSYFIS